MLRAALLCVLLGAVSARAQTAGASPSPEASPSTSIAKEAPAKFVPQIAREAAGEGNEAFARKDYVRARRAYHKVLDLSPDNLLALVNLGVVEFSAGDNKEAEVYLKRAVQQRIETAAAWLTLGIIYMDEDRLDEALAALTQATLYGANDFRAHNYLGVVMGRKGWFDAAQDELRKAIELNPNYTDANYNLAAFYLERNPPAIELARRHYYRAVELGAEPDPEMEKRFKSEKPKP